MYYPEYCLSADGESILMEKCDDSESQSFTLQRVSACDGHGTAYQLQVGGQPFVSTKKNATFAPLYIRLPSRILLSFDLAHSTSDFLLGAQRVNKVCDGRWHIEIVRL